jgi:hypothetical protein
MKRTKKDPTAWRSTPAGVTAYNNAKEVAQGRADATGFDFGLEWNDLFKEWSVRVLPARDNRSGHELRCEVVSATDINKQQKGHGCK